MTAIQVVTIILSLYRPPVNIAARIAAHRERIIEQADAAATHWNVPVEILLAVVSTRPIGVRMGSLIGAHRGIAGIEALPVRRMTLAGIWPIPSKSAVTG